MTGGPGDDERGRWELLLEAIGSMAADLSLDELLRRIVEIARDLAGSQYAALGVLGEAPGERLRLFITHGMTPAQVHEIGDLPVGHGLLGLIIDRPEPLRLHDIAEHPASYGFPPNHPPMRSFLGVPVRIRDKVFGNLYLTEKVGEGDFSEQDELIVTALATAAGVAIENARLHEQAARRERWLAATAEITGLLSQSASGADALQIVADRARELAGADIAWVVVGDAVEHLSLRVVSGASVDDEARDRLSLEDSIASSVVRTGIPVSVEDIASHPHAVDVARAAGLAPPRSGDHRAAAQRPRQWTVSWHSDGCRTGWRSSTRSTPTCPRGSPSRPRWRSRWPGPATTSNGSRSSRTGTGSAATCTTW